LLNNNNTAPLQQLDTSVQPPQNQEKPCQRASEKCAISKQQQPRRSRRSKQKKSDPRSRRKGTTAAINIRALPSGSEDSALSSSDDEHVEPAVSTDTCSRDNSEKNRRDSTVDDKTFRSKKGRKPQFQWK